MNVLHWRAVYDRRIERLATLVAGALPERAAVADVGCGDGRLAARVLELRPDVSIRGFDVLRRDAAAIPVELFDGRALPLADKSVDVVTCVDVLHHADDINALLAEFRRVARRAVVIKDHLREGVCAQTTLRFMDWVGNARFGVALPYHYLTRREWHDALARASLRISAWNEQLGIYVRPFDWFFGRRLHVFATLTP